MKPIEVMRTRPDEKQLILQLHIPASLNWFCGHFPAQPLLPGVAQLDWVMAYGAELAPGMRFSAINSVKFQRPLLPDSLLELILRWDSARSLLAFEYVLLKEAARLPVSSGKIKLCP